jgi:hypothetical protein
MPLNVLAGRADQAMLAMGHQPGTRPAPIPYGTAGGRAPRFAPPLAAGRPRLVRCRSRHTNAYHPGSFAYFTPPPLAMSIAGEVLAQWANQGIDVWSCGPVGALVEEEVIRCSATRATLDPAVDDCPESAMSSPGGRWPTHGDDRSREVHLALQAVLRRPAPPPP